MSKETFRALCAKINSKVCNREFKPETHCPPHHICGEVQVAIGLRILFGASYLDLVGRAFGVASIQSIYNFFDTTIDWINATFCFELVDMLNQLRCGNNNALAELKQICSGFSADSDMVFHGCFGAIDGLAIRIKSPIEVPDPGNYFCRKNFYALNVQAICDKSKKCLWISPGHQGASHDSFAFSESKLYDLLHELKDTLKENGLFLVGDSAYPLSTFLLTPYDDAQPSSPEDSYNFWHSNARISIECFFGELIMRCGLFWRPLQHSLKMSCNIVRAAALLHNFLVDYRENPNVRQMEEDYNFYDDTPTTNDVTMVMPLVTDNNEPMPTGRKSMERIQLQADGRELRNTMRTALLQAGLRRPKTNGMRYSSRGLVYFE
ncbi:hypothetical protein ACHAWX_002693 [Stephanocyclus meneghinianus]